MEDKNLPSIPLLQDCDSGLSKALANAPHARWHAKDAAHAIEHEREARKAAQPAPQPLTEAQIHAMKCAAAYQGITGIAPSLHLARAVEAWHGITAAPITDKKE